MMDIQKAFTAMSESGRLTRSDYHLTLGGLIKQLAALPPSLPVKFDWNGEYPSRERSYRGYYSDLALDWRESPTDVEGLLSMCQGALDSTYEGYKGGDFVMDERTPLWAAPYGSSGRAIMGLEVVDGVAVLETKEVD